MSVRRTSVLFGVCCVVLVVRYAATLGELSNKLAYYYYHHHHPNFSLLSFSWEIFTYPGMYHQQD
jgi:hypothetical protein